MKRREMIAVLGAAAVPAFVGSARAAETKTATPTPSDPPASDAQHTWMQTTMKIGSLSLLASRAAVDTAHGARVKTFAGWEVAEQETVGDILKGMKPSAPSPQGALNPPTDEEATAALDADMKGKLSDLKAKSGAGFDKAFVALELDGHKKLLTVQEDYLKVGKNQESLDVAKLARGMIKEHIDHLTAIQSDMG